MNPSISPQITLLDTASLFPSPTNPRKKFDPEKLAELCASIEQRGVKSPLLVRPVGDRYEIVAGERRFRAGQAAKLTEFPCIIEELSDTDVLELQLIENLQREDLGPLEESEHYQRMLELPAENGGCRYTVADLAEKIGKSLNYIYRFLKLKALPKKMRDALAEGEIGVTLADEVARIPSVEMRERAATDILNHHDGPMSTREAAEYIRDEYMVELKGAPFDPKDVYLVPVAFTDLAKTERSMGGACDDCPHRTGNNRVLYGEEVRGDICTHPPCYVAKREAAWKQATESAREEGKKVLTERESRGLFYYGSNDLAWNCDYFELDKQPPSDMLDVAQKGVPTWRKLIDGGPCKVQINVVRTPKGKILEVADRKQLVEAAKKNGHDNLFDKSVRAGSGRDPAEQKAAKAEREKAKLEAAWTKAGAEVLRKALEGQEETPPLWGPPPEFWWLMLEDAMRYHAGADGQKLVGRILDIKPVKERYRESYVPALLEYAKSFGSDSRKLAALTVMVLLAPDMRWRGLESEAFVKFADFVKLDIPALKKRVEKEMKAAKAASESLYITPGEGQGAAKIAWDKRSRTFKVKNAKGALEVSPRTAFCLGWNDAMTGTKRDLGILTNYDDVLRGAYREGATQGEQALPVDSGLRPDMKKIEVKFAPLGPGPEKSVGEKSAKKI